MKKVLLGTSAIALVGAFATSANAADWDVKVGGFFEARLAYADSDIDGVNFADVDGFDVKQDAEIIFSPSLTLDNGLKFGAQIQLEGNSDGDQIDESFMIIEGSFGRVLLGNENSAGYLMHYTAPDVTFFGVNSGDATAHIPVSGAVGGVSTGDDFFRGTLGATSLENGRNNDAGRITYFTPRFAGFQLGFSYARDGNDDDNAQTDCAQADCNFIDVGANYVNSFGEFDLALSGRWGIRDEDNSDDNAQVYGFGATFGFFGVTIGGSFAEQNNAGTDDGRAFDAGVSYETGPWGFSFTYFNGENVDDENVALGGDEQLQQFMLGMNYKLAKGVDLGAYGVYVDFDEDFSDGGAGTTGDDVDGFIIGTGVRLRF